MNRLELMEAAQNFLDLGILKETFQNAVRTKMEMGAKTFFKHLLLGKGYGEVTPPRLEKLKAQVPSLLIVDLREKTKFEAGHLKGAVSHPFDAFLKSVLVDGQYANHSKKPLLLVCDTGHQSRVAASILVEEGFNEVLNANRGMRRIDRWERLKAGQAVSQNRCCRIMGIMGTSINI